MISVKNEKKSIANSIFGAYRSQVEEFIGDSKHKTCAIKHHEERLKSSSPLIDENTIAELYSTFASAQWLENKNRGSNWVWHSHTRATGKRNDSKEVILERLIAETDSDIWTYQMSTSSGLLSTHSDKRSAIDLVRYNRAMHYAFIELKTGSDNPLYAAIEILGYAFAYLHAKKENWQGKGKHNVFDAEAIELTVLGNQSWYQYKKHGEINRFNFEWLGEEIANSLNALSGTPKFTMKFREYPDADNIAQDQVKAILNLWDDL